MLHTIARQSNKQQQSYIQHGQQQSAGGSGPQNAINLTGLPYAFQNMQLNADMSVHQVGILQHHKSGGSDSGSGSGGEISPPETPSNMSGMSGNSERREMVGNNRRGMRGINGRQQQQQQGQSQGAGSGIKGEPQQQGSVIYSTSSPLAGQFSTGEQQQQLLMSSNHVASSLISSNSQNNLQQLAGAMVAHGGNVTQSPTAFVNASTATTFPPGTAYLGTNRLPGHLLYIQQPIQFIPTQQPPPPQQQQVPSGATITSNLRSSPSLQIPPPTMASVSPQLQQTQPTLTSAYPANKMNQSCFNCGSTSHSGRECQEASMEDVTRNSIYKLDYNSSTGNTANVTSSTAGTPNQTTQGTTSTTTGQPENAVTGTNSIVTANTTTPGTTVPKIKPHFNPDIVPQSAIDQDEIIDLISDSSSNGSRK